MMELPKLVLPEADLPLERLERVEGWGMSCSGMSYVYRPVNTRGIQQILEIARDSGRPIGMRGAGRSYGDASLNSEGLLLEMTRMNRILDWNPQTGRITVEPGVTVQQMWQYIIEDGWWPPVVPGTMFPTLGGCASMNIHGKNNFKVGPIGDHILSFQIVLPSGEELTCSRNENPDIFHGAISGFGMLGVFTQLTLQMKRVYSGLLDVTAIAVGSFAEMFAQFEQRLPESDYLVGWVDCFASGESLGRGQIHQANYLAPGVDPEPTQTLRVINQELPDTFAGAVPKSVMWRMMKPLVNDPGMRAINFAKYLSSEKLSHEAKHRQTHAGFAFLLDYVPNWKLSYKPHGLIQYQSFVPAENALAVFTEQIRLAQHYGLTPYLGVFKRHRPDDFLMTHAVEGYSFALDFALTATNRGALISLAAEMDALVVGGGGRFYFAKDSLLHPSTVARFAGEERIQKFRALKDQYDPENLLQTNLYRRLFPKSFPGYEIQV
ncbi:MAG: FAD-binding oxidoreductase [Capsulimonas sp.]|uniref:FAD-dependent oxidoreductase n=1 Tax=Capsulimonas sp. TaxID=2494211 RepID=UPI00326612CA